MKPFDLEAALRGEPVKLAVGYKAYVLGRNPFDTSDEYDKIIGLMENPKRGVFYRSWREDGAYNEYLEGGNNIIGMWEEPVELVSINDHEFPKPYYGSMEKGQNYWVIAEMVGFDAIKFEWEGVAGDYARLNAGLVHLTQEAAEQHAAALNAVHKEFLR
ncbi:MAG: hypothetical protein Q4D82_01525 [Neisseria sp.]|nr:hypothetical protein [Neisseria sp.]